MGITKIVSKIYNNWNSLLVLTMMTTMVLISTKINIIYAGGFGDDQQQQQQPLPPIQNEKQYPLRLQPELDVLNITHILNTERLLNFQIKCLLYNGPCDVIGRWAKPRVRAAILGECLKCTPIQKGWMNEWMDKLINKRPELYRAAIAKYITNVGITIPQNELLKINQTLANLN